MLEIETRAGDTYIVSRRADHPPHFDFPVKTEHGAANRPAAIPRPKNRARFRVAISVKTDKIAETVETAIKIGNAPRSRGADELPKPRSHQPERRA